MSATIDRCPCCGHELQAGELFYCNDCSREINVDVHNKSTTDR